MPASPAPGMDMLDVCKRAASRLNIPWPAVVTETTSSHYEGKKFSRAKRTAKELLPVFHELFGGVSIQNICAVSSWSSPLTFVRFYKLDVS